MKKYRYFTDIDCEEQWLNKMADKGYGLKGKGFFSYRFADEATSDPSIVKIDYRAPLNIRRILLIIALYLKTADGSIFSVRKACIILEKRTPVHQTIFFLMQNPELEDTNAYFKRTLHFHLYSYPSS